MTRMIGATDGTVDVNDARFGYGYRSGGGEGTGCPFYGWMNADATGEGGLWMDIYEMHHDFVPDPALYALVVMAGMLE